MLPRVSDSLHRRDCTPHHGPAAAQGRDEMTQAPVGRGCPYPHTEDGADSLSIDTASDNSQEGRSAAVWIAGVSFVPSLLPVSGPGPAATFGSGGQ